MTKTRPENSDQASPDSNLDGCVRANDIREIDVIDQLDLDREQLGDLGIRARGGKAGHLTRQSGRGDSIHVFDIAVKTPAIRIQDY